MLYSNDKQLFEQTLIKKIHIPGNSFDYPFFAGDLVQALKSKGRVSIIPYKPFASGIGDSITDADFQEVNGIETITLQFEKEKDFTFYLNRKSIMQPAPCKYYVNDEGHDQEINITFINI